MADETSQGQGSVWDEVDATIAREDARAAPSPSVWEQVDGAIAQEDQGRDERLRRLFDLGLQKSPDEHASVAEIARQTGLSAGLVEQQLPVLKRAAAAAQFDPARFRKESPDLESLLLDYGTDPAAAAVVMQDGLLKRALRGIGSILGYAAQLDAGGDGTIEGARAAAFEQAQRFESGEQAMPKPPEDPFRAEVSVGAPSPSGELKGLERVVGKYERQPSGPEALAADATLTGMPIDTGTELKQTVPGVYQAEFDLNRRQMDYSNLGAQVVALKALGQADRAWELEKQALDMKRELGPRYYGESGFLEQVGLDAMSLLPSQIQVLEGGGVGGALGAGLAGGVVLALTRDLGAAKKAASMGWRKGAAAASFATSFTMEMGGAYLDAGELKTDAGKPVAEDLRVGASVAYGLVAAAVEVDALKPYLEMFGPVGDFALRGERKAFMAAMLKDATWRNILTDAGKRWVAGAYGEGKEEAIQQIAQDMFGYYARVRQAGDDSGRTFAAQSADVYGSLLGAADIFAKTFSGTLAMGAAGAVSTVVQHTAMRESALRGGQVVEQLAGLAESPSVRAAPELVAQAVQRETAKGGEPVRAMYVDAGAFLRLFQDAPGGLEQAATELQIDGGAQAVKEAAAGANGGRVEVPLATYLETWGPKGVAQALAADTAVRPGVPTTREQLLQDQQVEQRRAELVKEYLAENAAAPATEGEADLVDAAKAQLARTGIYDPGEVAKAIAPLRAFVRTQAEVAGVDPDVLFAEFAVRVDKEEARRPVPGMEAAPLAQPSGSERDLAEQGLAAARARLRAAENVHGKELSRVGQATAGQSAEEIGAAFRKDPALAKVTAERDAAQKEVARWEKRLKKAGGPRNLVVIHNLTGENLLHAAQLGGLAAPSIAVTRSEHPADGFGEITLVGGPDLIDPKTGVPVFNADVYSPRWPDTRWKVDEKKARAFAAWFRPYAEQTGTYLSDLAGELAKEGPEGLVQKREWKAGLTAAWLAEHGTPLEPQTRQVPVEREFSRMPAMLAFNEAHPEINAYTRVHDDPVLLKELSDATRRAIEEMAQQYVQANAFDAEDAKDMVESALKRDFDEAGLLSWNGAARVAGDLAKLGQTEVDRYANEDAALERFSQLDPATQDAIVAWGRQKLEAATAGQFIAKWTDTQDGGRWRHIPYTLENVLKELTRKVRAGEAGGAMSGLGFARSKGAKQFRSVEQIQAARDSIVEHRRFEELKDELDERFGQVADALKPYFQGDMFRLLDGLAEAVGESYRRGHYLSRELELSGFKGVPHDLQARVGDFARDLVALPSEYFEAKPQRAVQLSEFKAAVVPVGTKPEVLAELKKAGLKVFTYEKGVDEEQNRADATEAAARDRKVLFQAAFHGTPHRGIERFLTQFIGTGEGAQVFGWGLYFAGNREVAEEYRKGLSRKFGIETRTQWEFLPEGEEDPVAFMRSLKDDERSAWHELHARMSFWKSTFQGAGERVLTDLKATVEATGRTIEYWNESIARYNAERDALGERPVLPSMPDDADPRAAWDAYEEAREKLDEFGYYDAQLSNAAEGLRKALFDRQMSQRALALIEKYGLVAKGPREAGQLYKVEIPDDEHLLDWDAPFSKQPQKVQEAVRALFAEQAAAAQQRLHAGHPEWKAAHAARGEFSANWKDPYHLEQRDGGWVVVDAEGKPTTGEVNATQDEGEDQLKQDNAYAYDAAVKPHHDAVAAAENQQNEASDALRAMSDFTRGSQGAGEMLGYDVYRRLQNRLHGGDARATSEMLDKLGIPGIRYLDQGSRGISVVEKHGSWTVPLPNGDEASFPTREEAEAYADKQRSRNYVVWREDAIKTLESFYQPAWHGSPHKGIERFSLQKIGTGEGAQAYGWGLYFAEDKGVAEFYRESLTSGRTLLDGLTGRDLDNAHAQVLGWVTSYLQSYGDSVADALVYARRRLRENAAEQEIIVNEWRALAVDKDFAAQSEGFKVGLREKLEIADGVLANLQAAIAAADAATPARFSVDNGGLYKVELPENHELLDYDRTLAEQSPAVQAAARKFLAMTATPASHVETYMRERSGYDLYQRITDHPRIGNGGINDSTTAARAASLWLDAQGIPGLRYLNGNGDAANFVIWNEARIDLMERQFQRRRTLTPEQEKRLGALEVQLAAETEKRTLQLREQGHAFPEAAARESVWGRDASSQTGPIAEAVKEALYLRGYDVYPQDPGDGPRGYVDMMRDGLKRIFDVVFTQRADLSTFLHESGHIFLEMMGDLAERQGAPERLTEDWKRTLSWLGVKDRSEIQREHHEKWAHAFERYLMEGKAPSLRLVGAFQRFRLWLKDIYGQLTSVSPDLDDSIRSVFDRLLATDAEIEHAKQAMGAGKPLFRSPAEAGMTPEAFQAYLADREESFKGAALKAARRTAEEQLRATDEYLKSERTTAEQDAGLEFDRRPEQVAVRFLRRGEASGNPALEALVTHAREQAKGDATGALTDAEKKKLSELQGAVAELEVERRLAAEVERLVAGGAARDQAEKVARKLLAESAGDPTRLPSFTTTAHFLYAKDEAGKLLLEAPWRGEEVPEGTELHPVTLPTWLPAEEFSSNSLAWEWTWAALEAQERTLVGNKLKNVTTKTGQVAPEAVQRLVHGFVARALEAFPEPDRALMYRAFALAKLFAPDKNGKRAALPGTFRKSMQEQVAKWLLTPEAERKYDDPLSPKQWELLLKDTTRFNKRYTSLQGGWMDRLWIGSQVDAETARKQREAPAGEAAKGPELEARLAALRQEAAELNAAAIERAVGKVRPKLDYAAVVALVGPEAVKEKFHGLTQLEGGLAPDELAEILRVDSGAELVQAINERPERSSWVSARADELVNERRPDVVAERARLAEIAQQALHNEGTVDWLLKEWVALKRKAVSVINQETGKVQQVSATQLTDLAGKDYAAQLVPLEAIRLAAQDIVDRQVAGEINASRALTAERQAAERSAKAAAKGDYKLAYVEKQKQLLNHYLYRYLTEAKEARAAFEKLGARMSDPKRRGLLGKAGGVFLSAGDSILEAFGFKAKPTDPAELAARPTLPDILKALEEQGIVAGFDAQRLSWLLSNPPQPGVTAKGNPIPAWKGLTVADLRLVGAALSQLYVAARDLEQVKVEGQAVAIATLLGDIRKDATGRNTAKPPPPGSNNQAGGPERGKKRLSGLDASLADPEQMLEDLGPTAYRFFWQGYLDARNHEDRLAERVYRIIDHKWTDLPEAMRRRRDELLQAKDLALVPFPADVRRDGERRDRMWAWMVALNMGNRSNMERLLGGYEWDEGAVRTFLDNVLTDEEWTFIESVWHLLDKELYPEVAAQYERVNGIRPEKIEALPFTLQSGRVISGGYFPARYDPVASRVGEKQRVEALGKLYNTPAATSVAKSFTKERVKKYEDVINLQWSEVPRHVGQVLHYIAFDSFTRDAARVMGSGEMKAIVDERLGERYYPQLEQWLRVAASDQADAIPEHLEDVAWALGELRSRFVMQTLGLSVTVAMGDLANPLVAIAAGHVKLRYMAPALAEGVALLPAMFKGTDEPHAKSAELRNRRDNMRRKVKMELAAIGHGEEGLHARAREMAWVTMEATDLMTATVIWLGAYKQAQAQGKGEKEAVRAADQVVRKNLPSHNLAEQPAFLRDKRGVGAIVAFYGYFSKLYNVMRGIWRPATVEWMTAQGKGEKLAAGGELVHAAGRTFAVILATNVLSELLSGRGPEDDEKWGEWMLRKILAAPFSWVPIVGSAGEAGVNAGVSKLFHGKSRFRSFSARASPGMAGVERAVRALGTIVGEGKKADQRAWALLEAYGFFAKLPTGQIIKTGSAITSGEVGRDARSGRLGSAAGDVMYGKRVNPTTGQTLSPKNPGSALSDMFRRR